MEFFSDCHHVWFFFTPGNSLKTMQILWILFQWWHLSFDRRVVLAFFLHNAIVNIYVIFVFRTFCVEVRGFVLLYLRSPKGGCYSKSDNLSCLREKRSTEEDRKIKKNIWQKLESLVSTMYQRTGKYKLTIIELFLSINHLTNRIRHDPFDIRELGRLVFGRGREILFGQYRIIISFQRP